MNSTAFQSSLARVLGALGIFGMVVGTLDPLEGCVAILAGSGLIALGQFLGKAERRELAFSLWVFGLIAVGVAAMFGLTAIGGGGGPGHPSSWWLLLAVTYPVGWVLGIVHLVFRLVRRLRRGKAA
jgi:hypothetical protein